MTEPTGTTQGEPQEQQNSTSSDGTLNTDTGKNIAPVPYDRFKATRDELNDISAKYQAAQDALKKHEEAEAQRKQAELEQQGKWQEIVEDLKPKAARVDALEATLKTYLDSEMEAIPEEYRKLVPKGDVTDSLSWIADAKASGLFSRPPAPNMDAGARGDARDTVELTPGELAMAQRMGIDPKKMIETKKREQRGN